MIFGDAAAQLGVSTAMFSPLGAALGLPALPFRRQAIVSHFPFL
jgi:hypothetical protein